MAVSPDQFRMIYFQGHPEYDLASLLKEYKREVMRYAAGELDASPSFPENYFSDKAALLAGQLVEQAVQTYKKGEPLPGSLEEELQALLDNTWGDTAKAVVNNWLGLVYKLTNLDRKQQYMEGVDLHNPLGMRL